MYLFHGKIQLGLEVLGFLQVLAEVCELTKVFKLLHL